jgi:ketosteroid isomerase-like protein
MPTEDMLHAYCTAFAAKDVEAILALFGKNGVYELPLLCQRLVGHGEIRAGLARVFEVAESCVIEIFALKSATTTIAEGRLRAKLHRDREPVAMPLALVMATEDGLISRLSTYLDARPYRLWSDGPIFAAAG